MAQIINGFDVSDLSHNFKLLNYPEQVPGRTVHIDADFLAYQVSFDEQKTLEKMQHGCDEIINRIVKLGGAEHYVLYLTPHKSDKGNRYNIALLKEYQSTRKSKPKPKMLHVIRDWMHNERGAIMCLHAEADDGMASAQYKTADKNLSIIASKDKDLTIVPGLNLDWDTGEISDTADDNFGWIELDCSGKQKKIRGRGWKYFWAQMLTGDPADTISGLPKICDPELFPKPKLCGPVTAFDVLNPIQSNVDAFLRVRELYKQYGDMFGFVNYRDESSITYKQAFVSEAQLLWMRREPENDHDVLFWMKEHCL